MAAARPGMGWALEAIVEHTRGSSPERTNALAYLYSCQLFIGAKWCAQALRSLAKDLESSEHNESFDGGAMMLMSAYYARLIDDVGEENAKAIKKAVAKELKLEVRM